MPKSTNSREIIKGDFGDFFEKNKAKQKTFEMVDFVGCNLQEIKLTNFNFVDCKFLDCNLSLVKLDRSGFLDVDFVRCKLSGVNFNLENLGWNFSVSFEDCLINYCSFTDLSFKKSKMYNSDIVDCSFMNVDLSFCNCQKSDFNRTIFHKVDFSGADFRGATNYFIDIFQKPKLKGCKFSRSEVVNLLSQLELEIE